MVHGIPLLAMNECVNPKYYIEIKYPSFVTSTLHYKKKSKAYSSSLREQMPEGSLGLWKVMKNTRKAK